jgi:hypothetical protein
MDVRACWQEKIRILLNKVQQIDTQQLMRVYGALMWSLGKVLLHPNRFVNMLAMIRPPPLPPPPLRILSISSTTPCSTPPAALNPRVRSQVLNVPEVPRVFMGSFWDQDETNTDEEWLGSAAHAALLEREKSDLLRELVTLPQNSIMRRVSELVRTPPARPAQTGHASLPRPAPVGKEAAAGGCVLRVCPAPPPLLLLLPVSLLYTPSLPPSPDRRGAGSLTNPGHRATRRR